MSKKEEFLEIYKQYIKRDGADKLLEWLESSDFFVSPASTKFHSNYVGGLCDHSVNVFKRLKNLVVAEYGENYWEHFKDKDASSSKQKADESLAIMGLLHDVCKIGTYKVEYKNVKVYCENGSKVDNGGRFEWESQPYFTVQEELPYGHGEKSVYELSAFIKLSREEAMAINWHMGGYDLRVKGGSFAIADAYYKFPIAVMLANADMMATYLDEKVEK